MAGIITMEINVQGFDLLEILQNAASLMTTMETTVWRRLAYGCPTGKVVFNGVTFEVCADMDIQGALDAYSEACVGLRNSRHVMPYEKPFSDDPHRATRYREAIEAQRPIEVHLPHLPLDEALAETQRRIEAGEIIPKGRSVRVYFKGFEGGYLALKVGEDPANFPGLVEEFNKRYGDSK